MKIIQVSTFFHPSVGGVERQVEEIASHLRDLGDEVTIYTTDASHGEEVRMQRLDDTHRNLPIKRFRYYLSLGDFFRFAPGLSIRLLFADYDLLHVHNVHDAHLLPAIITKLIRKKKLVLTAHNPYMIGEEKRGGRLNRNVGFFEWVLRFLFRYIDRYIALIDSEKEEVIRRFNYPEEKIIVIPNGIQDLYYEQAGDKDVFYKEWGIEPDKWKLIVGTVSRLNFVKGIQNLKNAVEENPEVLFIFAGGDDGYYDSLKRIYRDSSNVLFTEQYIPSHEVRNFYQAIDMFLLPSVYEPFGMTVVEAMAQSKPVLVTSAGGPPEFVSSEFGEVIDPDDQEKWAERIRYYSEDKYKLEMMSRKARVAADSYRWDKVISQIKDLYKGLF